jgi:hypothetical protein
MIFVTIFELRRLSAAAFGHKYRLELLSALAVAGQGEGVCLSLLGHFCRVTASVYYPPVRAMTEAGMVVSSGRVHPSRHVLYARTANPVWTGLRRMVEDLPVDVNLADAALDWPEAS